MSLRLFYIYNIYEINVLRNPVKYPDKINSMFIPSLHAKSTKLIL